MDTATITARLDLQTKEKLENLARATRRSRSFLVAEAVRAYVEDQAWQLKAIEEGLRQADAGEFAGEDEVKATFYKWGVDA